MRLIQQVCSVSTGVDEAWSLWTTNEGVRAFFAPDSDIQLWLGGKYELYFDPSQPEGDRGSEEMKVLSFIPKRLLSFEWNQPPSIPDLRRVKTWVILEFSAINEDECELTLTHLGFGTTDDWDRAHQYFTKAWEIVLERFKNSITSGPIDWSNL